MTNTAATPSSETTPLRPTVVRTIAFIRKAEIQKRKRKRLILQDKLRSRNIIRQNMGIRIRYPRRTSYQKSTILRDSMKRSGRVGENIILIHKIWPPQSKTWTEIDHSMCYHRRCSTRMRSKCRGDTIPSSQVHSKTIACHNADPQISLTKKTRISPNHVI